MKVKCIIPARYESSRLPGKPLADICGKPMIWWVHKRVSSVRGIDEIIVATDDERIFSVCEGFGIKVVMTSKSHQTGTDRAGEVAKKHKADVYIIVQGDEPLVDPKSIQAVISPFLKNPKIKVTSIMSRITNPVDLINSTTVKVVTTKDGDALLLSRSPIPYPKSKIDIDYYKAIGIYGIRYSALKLFSSSPRGKIESIEDSELLRFIDNGIKVRFVEFETRAISVDTQKDLDRVRNVIKNDGSKDEKF